MAITIKFQVLRDNKFHVHFVAFVNGRAAGKLCLTSEEFRSSVAIMEKAATFDGDFSFEVAE